MPKWKLVLSALIDILLLRWNKYQEEEEKDEVEEECCSVDTELLRKSLSLANSIPQMGNVTAENLSQLHEQAKDIREYCRVQLGETDIDQDVINFNRKFGQPAPDRLEMPSDEVMQFREELVLEEVREFLKEWQDLRHMRNAGLPVKQQMAKVAAEAVDVVYVVVGCLVVLGLRLLPFWKEVQIKNMQKQVNPNGGKPLKPLGWSKPDTLSVLNGEFDE